MIKYPDAREVFGLLEKTSGPQDLGAQRERGLIAQIVARFNDTSAPSVAIGPDDVLPIFGDKYSMFWLAFYIFEETMPEGALALYRKLKAPSSQPPDLYESVIFSYTAESGLDETRKCGDAYALTDIKPDKRRSRIDIILDMTNCAGRQDQMLSAVLATLVHEYYAHAEPAIEYIKEQMLSKSKVDLKEYESRRTARLDHERWCQGASLAIVHARAIAAFLARAEGRSKQRLKQYREETGEKKTSPADIQSELGIDEMRYRLIFEFNYFDGTPCVDFWRDCLDDIDRHYELYGPRGTMF